MSRYTLVVLVLVLAVMWKTLPRLLLRAPVPQHGGFVHPDFAEVQEIFRANIESGREPGASFAVSYKGEVLVDLWGGVADPETKRPWKRDTLTQAWSCTKGMVAVIMALLVDRGRLRYDEYVSTYWPEFGQNGKADITVGVLLSHKAGLVSLGKQISLLDYRDNWTEIERLMVEQKPAWPPGTRYCYHALTFGMYADAVVRRVDPKHRNISQFFKEEIAEPYDVDFYIGLPPDQYFRSTRARFVGLWDMFLSTFIYKPHRWAWLPEAFMGDVLFNSIVVFDFMENMDVMNDAEYRSVGLPSAVGFGTARSMAKVYDFLANNGSVKGKQLLSPQSVQALATPATEKTPVIAVPDEPFSMGMMVAKNALGQAIFGHGGYGGQLAYADQTHQVGVAYVTNFNSEHSDSIDPRALDLLHVFYRCLLKSNITTVNKSK